MKIEHVESLVLGDVHLVLVTTEDGRTGLGQSACWGYPAAVHEVVAAFRPALLGQDADRIEHLWHYLYRMAPFRGSILGAAVSAVDIALWDLKAQRLGVPVWQLFGGKVRDRIRLHRLVLSDDPDTIVAEARAAVGEGFTAVKFDPLPAGYADMAQDRLVRTAVDLSMAVREAVGPDVDLILELHRKLTPLQARPLLAALAPVQALFIEDPIQIDSTSSQAALTAGSPPLGEGERLHTIWEFRELLERGGAQYVRPDLGLAGGFSQCRKIAALAEAYHAAVVTHNFLGPVLTAASVHLDASIPNFVVQEYSMVDEGPLSAAFVSTLRREGGYLAVPEVPGLGVTLADERPSEIRIIGREITSIPLRADGSVAFSV